MPINLKWADGTPIGAVPTPQELTEKRLAAIAVATHCAKEMARKLEGRDPKDLGYPDTATADELIISEWRAWYEQERKGAS
jgi:hypothetical protein